MQFTGTRVTWSIDTLYQMWVPDPQAKGRFGGPNPQPKHAVANCSQTVSPMLPRGEYKRGVEWNFHSDSAVAELLWSLFIFIKVRRRSTGRCATGSRTSSAFCSTRDRPMSVSAASSVSSRHWSRSRHAASLGLVTPIARSRHAFKLGLVTPLVSVSSSR